MQAQDGVETLRALVMARLVYIVSRSPLLPLLTLLDQVSVSRVSNNFSINKTSAENLLNPSTLTLRRFYNNYLFITVSALIDSRTPSKTGTSLVVCRFLNCSSKSPISARTLQKFKSTLRIFTRGKAVQPISLYNIVCPSIFVEVMYCISTHTRLRNDIYILNLIYIIKVLILSYAYKLLKIQQTLFYFKI